MTIDISPNRPTRQQWVIYALLFLLFIFLVPKVGCESDMVYWRDWAGYIHQHGLGNAYQEPSNNYPPLFHYVLFLFGKIAGSPQKIDYNIYYLKLFVLPFDFGGAILAAWFFAPGDRNQRFMASLLLLANVAFLYNTLIWTQVDALFSALVFSAFVLALRHRPVMSVLCFVLAFNAKTQAIIFLPPLLLLWALLWWRTPRTLLLGLLGAAVVQSILLIPFMWAGDHNDLGRVLGVMLHGVDFYPYITMNAHNWWQFMFKDTYVSDAPLFAGLSYKQWGLLTFMIASAVVLSPMALAAWRKFRHDKVFGLADAAPLLLSFGLLPLVFTYFNTQMHERYWHPSLLYLASYGFLTGRHFLYGSFSLAYLLNLEAVLHSMGLKNYGVFLFSGTLGAILFTIVLVASITELYRCLKNHPDWPLLPLSGRQPTVARGVALNH